jgi:drug/metabolite transporter (DMT)-like permease
METLTSLFRMTFVEIGVIPCLFLAMPHFAAVVKRQTMPSAVGLTILTFATPTLMLVWAVFAFGQGRHLRWVQIVPLVLAVAGVLGTSVWLRRTTPTPPPYGLLSASPSAHSSCGVARSS